MQNLRQIISLAIGAVFSIAPSWPASASEVLITEQEAKLPPAKGTKFDSRGITRGPRIALLTELGVHSPIHLQLKFQAFGGAKIDLDTLHVTLLKTPEVDLTPRVKPFAQVDGIDMPEAVSPAGEYDLRVELRDTDGRPVAKIFSLKVAP
jgi:hypothetical protein